MHHYVARKNIGQRLCKQVMDFLISSLALMELREKAQGCGRRQGQRWAALGGCCGPGGGAAALPCCGIRHGGSCCLGCLSWEAESGLPALVVQDVSGRGLILSFL